MSLARKVAVNTTTLTAGRIAFAVSGVVGTAVATRYLGPGSFSSLTLALLLVSIFATLGEGGVYQVVAREIAKAPEDEDRLLANTLGLGLVVALLATLLALAVSQLVYGAPDRFEIRQGTAILLVQLLFTALAGTAGAHLTAHQRLVPVAVAAVLAAVVFLVVLAVVVALDWGFAGVAAAYATSGIVTAAPILVLRRSRGVRIAADLEVWRRLLRWAAPQAAIVVIGVLYFRIDTFMLSFLGTDLDVANYGVAYKVVEFLMFVPVYFMATLFPELSRAGRHTPELAGRTQAAFSLLQLAAVLMAVVFAAFAGEIVRIIAGPEYAGAAGALAILAIALLFFYLGSVLSQALIAQGLQLRLLRMLVTVLVANVLLNVVLIPPLGVEGAALAVVITELAALVLSARIFRDIGAVPRLFRPARVALAGAVATAVALAVRALGEGIDAPAVAVLAVGTPAVVAAYAGALVALRAVPGEIAAFVAPLRRRLRPA